jgi:shikimate kinase
VLDPFRSDGYCPYLEMSYQPTRTIILSGIKHSGKSTCGRELAESWNLPFYDLDDLIVELCRQDRGGVRAVTWEAREIYRRLGKKAFQELELRALEKLASDRELAVIALGGGTQENPEARRILSAMGILVYLHEEAQTLFRRIEVRGIPPFLDSGAPWESFLLLYRSRDALYRGSADLTVSIAGRPLQEAKKRIVHALEEYQHGR